MTADYDALVYDLDGTLVRLDVDWREVRGDCAGILRARGVSPDGADLWTMLDIAAERGFRDRLEATIAEYEREGARSATRLPLADDLPQPVPVGVCSLNAESACRIALELHGLDGHVGAVVGRDSLDAMKPDPAPLLATLDGLGADPDRALFVGDSESDRQCAERAGVDFQYAADRREERA